MDWKTTTFGKKIWRILEDRENLWVNWIHAYYVHKDDFWQLRAINDASTVWKHILKTRSHFKELMHDDEWAYVKKESS